MLVYVIALIVLIYPYLNKGTEIRDDSPKRTMLCFLVLFLVSGLSYNLGADTRGLTSGFGYVDHFQSVPELSQLTSQNFSAEKVQPGFVYILSFFKTLSPNYFWYQLFHAFLINLIVVFFVKKNTQYVGLCLFFYCLLYFLDLNFEIQRESYAIVLGLCIYLYLDNHKGLFPLVIAIGIVVSAFLLLHRSAFILILIPLLKNIRLNKLGIIICFVTTILIQVIWMKFTNIGMMIDVIAGDVYRSYVNQEVLDSFAGVGSVYFLWLTFWRVAVPYAFVYFSYKYCNPKYLIFVVLSIMFENLMYFSFAFHRMYGYFTPFYWLVLTDGVVYIGRDVKMMKGNFFRTVLIICMTLFIIYTYHGDYFREDPYPTSDTQYVYNWYIPYQTILDPDNSYME